MIGPPGREGFGTPLAVRPDFCDRGTTVVPPVAPLLALITRMSTEDMLRVLPAQAIAQAVCDAYHGDKLHWYVPCELEL